MIEKKTWAMLMMTVGVPLAVGALGLLLKKFFGCPCQFCKNNRMTFWRELDVMEQEAIRRYFRGHEKRNPDTSAVFLCRKCGTVFDDFSGERRSLERDMGAGCTTWCKVCNSVVTYCDPDNENIVCSKCKTHYAWQVHEKSGHRFLMPPKDASVLKECRGTVIADI